MKSIKVILFIALVLCLSVEAGKKKKKDVVRPSQIQLQSAQGEYKGTYSFMNKHSGQVISVQDDATGNRALIVLYGSGSHQSQQWKVYYSNGYYAFQAVHSGRWLDCPGLSQADRTQMIQWDWNGGANQLWQWSPVSAQYGFWYSKNSGKVLDALSWGVTDNTPLIQWPAKSGTNAYNQLWTWVRIGTN